MNVEIDAGDYGLEKGNTSRADARPEERVITIENTEDLTSLYYDMGKNKYLHIFNHFEFDKTRAFGNVKPDDREGTHADVDILKATFKPLGFKVQVYPDLSRYQLKKTIEKLIKDEDHSNNTSCMALAILTHGTNNGYLYAKDEPYELKEITKLLEHQKLVLIPKLLFLQISMVMAVLPPAPMLFHRMGSWRLSITRFTRLLNSRIFKFYAQMRYPATTTSCDAAIESDCNNRACRGHALDKGNTVVIDGIRRDLVHVPSHIDFLILYSTYDGYVSFRDEEKGTWMIKSLCSAIQEYHKQLDILQLITIVNKRVSLETAFSTDYPVLNYKKQTVEARYTLTKFLKL